MKIFGQVATRNAQENYRAYEVTRATYGKVDRQGGLILYLMRCNEKNVTTSHTIIGAKRITAFLKEAEVKKVAQLEGRVVLGLIGLEDRITGIALGEE